MIKFKINNHTWSIKEKTSEELLEMYSKEHSTANVSYLFGVTWCSQQEIWINKNSCEEQRIKTLKHELAHCYMWEYGMYYADNYNEEIICDLIATSNEFINEVVEKYKKENK